MNRGPSVGEILLANSKSCDFNEFQSEQSIWSTSCAAVILREASALAKLMPGFNRPN
jgi:hypothetical protein